MKVYLGADHRGYSLKTELADWLNNIGYEVEDCGADEYDKDDDYVDYAVETGNSVVRSQNSEDKGIVICGSGVGVSVAANKIDGIRCGLGLNAEQVKVAREDDDINVLALAADFVSDEQAKEMVKMFLGTKFDGAARHKRRLVKLSELSE